jgi:hypothetical protein
MKLIRFLVCNKKKKKELAFELAVVFAHYYLNWKTNY